MSGVEEATDTQDWPSPSAIPFRTTEGVRLVEVELVLDVVARSLGLTLDAMLEQVERWATNEGLPYGVIVDRENQTVTQAGEA